MKSFKTLLSASALTIALSSVSMAQVSTTGQTNPSPVSASGQIAKYVNFTENDTAINLGTLSGPMFSGVHTSEVSDPDLVTAGNQASNDDAAEITWDANTHIAVTITNGSILSNGLTGADADTLPTAYLLSLKGVNVNHGPNTANSSPVVGASAGYVTTTGYRAPGDVHNFWFGHGPASGLKINVSATRSGVNDHFGTYTTGNTTLTYADVN